MIVCSERHTGRQYLHRGGVWECRQIVVPLRRYESSPEGTLFPSPLPLIHSGLTNGRRDSGTLADPVAGAGCSTSTPGPRPSKVLCDALD